MSTTGHRSTTHLVRLRYRKDVSDRLGPADAEGPHHRAVHDAHHRGLDSVRVEPHKGIQGVADVRGWADNIRWRLLESGHVDEGASRWERGGLRVRKGTSPTDTSEKQSSHTRWVGRRNSTCADEMEAPQRRHEPKKGSGGERVYPRLQITVAKHEMNAVDCSARVHSSRYQIRLSPRAGRGGFLARHQTNQPKTRPVFFTLQAGG